ncbi:Thymidylate kinase [Flexistipes sinusarabici DSM 4947]|uniref:Thymidylate kinase n=1 Tax=Flexistipes sinusarabici (strain ATCC 49648 / DSM 4947 / MAS 10) TaxID=717231 RepID=F8E784_FLESM|nr:dTMP kinase [Flexistipes sinusarabici]AEI13799.1 Thymidylate kinase [Flexistipes sinusarabici DSM 4947]
MQNRKGLFITIDGIDGCGKSSQVRKLAADLKEKALKKPDSAEQREIILTKEPGGTKAGKIFRDLLISSEYDLDPITELLLYCADRREHQNKVVIPETERENIVICDRFIMSTYAYQIFGRRLDSGILEYLTARTINRMPDLSIIIDVDIDTAVARARKRLERDFRMHQEGKFEQMPGQFFERVREGFLWYADNHKDTVIIDGNRSFNDVNKDIMRQVDKIL